VGALLGPNVDANGRITPTTGTQNVRFELLNGPGGAQIVAGGTVARVAAPGTGQGAAAPFSGSNPDILAPKIGCSGKSLLAWVKRHEVDHGQREGVTTSERERIKALERENRELNDILRTASAFFAQAELDRRLKS